MMKNDSLPTENAQTVPLALTYLKQEIRGETSHFLGRGKNVF